MSERYSLNEQLKSKSPFRREIEKLHNKEIKWIQQHNRNITIEDDNGIVASLYLEYIVDDITLHIAQNWSNKFLKIDSEWEKFIDEGKFILREESQIRQN